MRKATNPQTGEQVYFDETSKQWKPLDVPSREEKLAAEMTHPAKPRPAWMEGLTPEQAIAHPLFEMGGGERFLAGMGQAFDSTARGLTEAGKATPGGATSTENLIAQRFPMGASEVPQTEGLRDTDTPLLKTPGGLLGSTAGHAAQMAGLGALAAPKTALSAAGLSGLYGAAQPGTPEERAMSGGLSALGGYVGQKAGQLVSRGIGKASPHQRAVNQRAMELGAKLTPGNMTKSDRLLRSEVAMSRNPKTSMRFAEIRSHNQSLLNKYAARSFGEDATEITPDLLGNASNRISGTIERALSDQKIDWTPAFRQKVSDIAKQYGKSILGRGDSRINNSVDYLKELPVKIDGTTYQQARSELSKAIHDAYIGAKPNANLGKALEEIADTLDDAARASIPDENLKAFNMARRQWGNLMTVEKNLKPDKLDVSGPKLANHLAKNRKSAYLRGKDANLHPTERDLFDFTRFVRQNGDIVGDSGTGTAVSQSLNSIVNPIRGSAVGGATYLMTGDPTTAAIAGAASIPLTAAARGAGQAAYFSPLTSALMGYPGVSSPAARSLIEAVPRSLLGGSGTASSGLLPLLLPQAKQ